MQVEEMSNYEVLELMRIVEKNYGYCIDLSRFKVFKNREGKIYLFNKVSLSKDIIKKASHLGLYFGKIKRNEKIQLSVEGSQLIGKFAKRNIAILDKENIQRFIEGLSCTWKELVNCEFNNFVLIKHENDFYGCGILRENNIEPFVPKGRRIMKELRKI